MRSSMVLYPPHSVGTADICKFILDSLLVFTLITMAKRAVNYPASLPDKFEITDYSLLLTVQTHQDF